MDRPMRAEVVVLLCLATDALSAVLLIALGDTLILFVMLITGLPIAMLGIAALVWQDNTPIRSERGIDDLDRLIHLKRLTRFGLK
jgi:hypothetical protein